jgi:hypothetical protein
MGDHCTCKRAGDEKNIRRSWIFRYSLAGRKPKDMGLGSLDAVDVVQAREKAREYRGLVLQGLDPIATRDAEKSANIAKTAVQKNFQQCCEDYLTSHRASWKRARQADDWKAAMETDAYPHLDKNLSVADINTQHVLNVPLCPRRGQYRKETLISRFGGDVLMPGVRHLIAECPRKDAPGAACGVFYADFAGVSPTAGGAEVWTVGPCRLIVTRQVVADA